MPRLRGRFPDVPDRAWRAVESVGEREFAVAAGIVGVVMAAVSAAGQASGGRSRFFQLMLAGFGLHTADHLASAADIRGYAPGVVTAPLVAAPFSVRAIYRLKAAGVWRPVSASDIIPGAALALAVLGGSHALARVLPGRMTRTPLPAHRHGRSHGPQLGAQNRQLCMTMAAERPRFAAAQFGGYCPGKMPTAAVQDGRAGHHDDEEYQAWRSQRLPLPATALAGGRPRFRYPADAGSSLRPAAAGGGGIGPGGVTDQARRGQPCPHEHSLARGGPGR